MRERGEKKVGCRWFVTRQPRKKKKKKKKKRKRFYSASACPPFSHSKRPRHEDNEAPLHPASCGIGTEEARKASRKKKTNSYRSSTLWSPESFGAGRRSRRASRAGRPAAPPQARAGASPRGQGRGRQARTRRCGPPSRAGSSWPLREDARLEAGLASGLLVLPLSSSSSSPLPPPRFLRASPSFPLLQSRWLPRRRRH